MAGVNKVFIVSAVLLVTAVLVITVYMRGFYEPVIGGGCGTVSPAGRDACCARQNTGKPHIMCVGSWRFNTEKAVCEYACDTTIDVGNFQECVEAGYPVLESYPRQCRTPDGGSYTEVIEEPVSDEKPIGGGRLTYKEAVAIAEASGCMQEGRLKDTYVHNPSTHTWWIDLDSDKPGCSPACVVSEETGTAEVNWRCTGLLPPK
jgi:hypothetical protein